MVRVVRVFELLNVQGVFLVLDPYLELDDGSFVVVTVSVLRGRENGDDLGELPFLFLWSAALPVVHAIAFVLHLMCPCKVYLIKLISLLLLRNLLVASTPKM